jgi:flagellar motor switch protein FliG
MDAKNLPGSLKVAILIQSMGPHAAGEILNSLGEEERGMIRAHLSQMGAISPDLVEKVAKEFTELAESLRNRNTANVNPANAKDKNTEEATSSDSGRSGLRSLQSLEPDEVLELIREEHPQTIAVIIVHLKPESASAVLGKLPDEIKVDVAMRIANLDKVVSGMVEEIDRVFEDILKSKETSTTHKTGGVSRLAEILNHLNEVSGELILNQIEESNPELAAQIKQKMFVFEDLVLVDDRGLQKMLRRIESKDLAVALKGASDQAKQKIFRNMSIRAAEMLKEEMDTSGAVRMKEVEDARQNITRIIQDMERKGDLIISGRRGEEFVA